MKNHEMQLGEVYHHGVSQTRILTITYVVTLSVIAVFSILIHFMLDQVIAEQTDTARTVNVSGQQRMLSQRASLFTVEYLSSGSEQFKQKALDTLKTMKENHLFLLTDHFGAMQEGQPSPLSNAIAQLYFNQPHRIDQKVKGFNELITALLNDEPLTGNEESKHRAAVFKKLSENSLLTSLDTVVSQYETESNNRINELRQIQQGVLFVILITLLAEVMFVFRPLIEKLRRLRQQADSDHLTGLLNRRSFELLAGKTLAMAARDKQPVSFISFDIDCFKTVNDSYGHDVGDKAIQHISQLISSGIRDSDLVCRFGGEEFVVLLQKTSPDNALLLAEKIRKNIENSPLILSALIIEMTVSGGVSQYLETEKGWFAVLKRSDKAMYQAKNTGRNKIVVA